MRRHHEAFEAHTWNHNVLAPEARVCLIINRFSRNLVVMYASSACEKVLHVDPDDLTGRPILLYIRADDLASFVEQVDGVKASTVIVQMRFWFQSPNWPQEIPCEAIMIGMSEGIVAVVRRCKPFVRKYFIRSREQVEGCSQGTSWSSGYSLYGTSTSTHQSSRTLSRATLNTIKILELERAHPLNFPEDNPNFVSGSTAMSAVPGFKEFINDDKDDDDDDEDEDEDEDEDVDMI